MFADWILALNTYEKTPLLITVRIYLKRTCFWLRPDLPRWLEVQILISLDGSGARIGYHSTPNVLPGHMFITLYSIVLTKYWSIINKLVGGFHVSCAFHPILSIAIRLIPWITVNAKCAKKGESLARERKLQYCPVPARSFCLITARNWAWHWSTGCPWHDHPPGFNLGGWTFSLAKNADLDRKMQLSELTWNTSDLCFAVKCVEKSNAGKNAKNLQYYS